MSVTVADPLEAEGKATVADPQVVVRVGSSLQ